MGGGSGAGGCRPVFRANAGMRQVYDRCLGQWVAVEAMCDADDVLVMVCDQLASVSSKWQRSEKGSTLEASSHRIVCERGMARLSAVYELRLPPSLECALMESL